MSRRPRKAARTLARGWSRDARRWTWATTAVLASTLVILVGTAGILDGTSERTLAQAADFYTGQLRITPSRPGTPPADWFAAGAAGELRDAGLSVSERVEAQYVLSRRSFGDIYANEQHGVPIDGSGNAADPQKVVTFGVLVGIVDSDPGMPDLQGHMVAGRMPRVSQPDTVEVLMSESRARAFLSPQEQNVPGSVLAIVGAFSFDVTSAQVDPTSSQRAVLHSAAKVVGLYTTGVDILDAHTLVAAAPDVSYLLGNGRDPAANVLLVQGGPLAAAREVAARNHWASQDTRAFADDFVGQLIGVLQAVAWLVAALLFLLPTALVAHGLARQLSGQQRELAVATAIGVPTRTLADALAMQVFTMAAWACLATAVLTLLMWLILPAVLPSAPAPLPLGFTVTWRSVLVAAGVTAVSVAVGLWVGMRSRARLPLAASLRAA